MSGKWQIGLVAVSILITALVLTLVFLEDFRFFTLPVSYVIKLYLYSFLGMIISGAVLIGMHHFGPRPWTNEPPVYRYLRFVFGFLWIIDGLMQLQPEMSFGFLSFVVYPVISSSPKVVQNILLPFALFWGHYPILLDALSGILQIFIGAGMLLFSKGRRIKFFFVLSLIWAFFLWVFGEAFGGIFSTGSSYLNGFPGSALIYALISMVMIFYRDTGKLESEIAIILSSIFLASALIQALPAYGFWSGKNLYAIPSSVMINQQPLVLSYVLHGFSVSFYYEAFYWNLAFVLLMISLGILWAARRRIASVLTITFSAFVWFVGMDFGFLGGYGTDPNTALPIMLISIIFLMKETYHPKDLDGSGKISTSG